MSNVSISDNTLQIGDSDYFHVEKIEVFTGDDSYNETDCAEITSISNKLKIARLVDHSARSNFRLRHETGVRIFLEAEDGGRFCLTVCHHKGMIQLVTEKLGE